MQKSTSSSVRRSSRLLRIGSSALLLASLLTLGVVSPAQAVASWKAGTAPASAASLGLSPQAAASSPTAAFAPGVPAAPVELFLEDFEAGTADIPVTLPNYTSAAAGSNQIQATGTIGAGVVSCTVSVQVTTNGPGSFLNATANVPTDGLTPPPPATLTVVDTDFGDAPATYGTAGASHTATTGLGIGAVRDAEVAALVTANALGDDNDKTPDDEDGITAANTTINAAGQALSIPVRNTTGSAATLVGWVDFNRDGDFLDAGEQSASVTVAPGATTASVT